MGSRRRSRPAYPRRNHHDYAIDRIRLGEYMPGAIIVHQHLDIGNVIDDLEIIAAYSTATEWLSQVFYLPLR
jgi:hypothetical protein